MELHLVVVPDTDTAVNLVEQCRAQVGELGGGDEHVRAQAVVVQELCEVETLRGSGVGGGTITKEHFQKFIWASPVCGA